MYVLICVSRMTNSALPILDLLSESVAHALAVLRGLTGITLLALFSYYRLCVWPRFRPLGAQPLGIATIAALVSDSRFLATKHLHANDTMKNNKNKLARLLFEFLADGGIYVITPDEEQA